MTVFSRILSFFLITAKIETNSHDKKKIATKLIKMLLNRFMHSMANQEEEIHHKNERID